MNKEKFILRGLLVFLAGTSIISTLGSNVNYKKLSGAAKTANPNYINIKNNIAQNVISTSLQTYNKAYRGIQDLAINNSYIYMSYHENFEVKDSKDKDHLRTYVVRCELSNCNKTKKYQIFAQTGRARQFDKYAYNNKNYMILSSNGFNKLTNENTYRVASKDYFNITTDSSYWKTFDNAYNTNDKRYNLSGKSNFKVPNNDIDSEISIDANNKKMALKVEKNISIYSIDPTKIKLNNKKYTFGLTDNGNKIPTYKNKEGKVVGYTVEDILLVGDYLYVAYTTNNENSDKPSYILTYDIKTGKRITENTRIIKNNSLKQLRLEALTYYKNNIYFAISYKENKITKNKIYKLTNTKSKTTTKLNTNYKFANYKENNTTVYVKETKTINLKVLNSNNKNVTVKSWKSSNSKIASVKNGKVTINSPGKVTITATMNNNEKATFTLTVRKKIIAVIGASQVTRMQDNYKENAKYGLYGIATANYNTKQKKWKSTISQKDALNKGLFFINSGGTGINFQTGIGMDQLLYILDQNKKYSKYINLYIYFPIAGNNAALLSCDNIKDNSIENTSISKSLYNNELTPTNEEMKKIYKNVKIKNTGNFFDNYLSAYNILIKQLKLKYNEYNIKTYVSALHPYDPLRTFEVNGSTKSDINKDSTINKEYINIIKNQRNNEITKRNNKNYNIDLTDCKKGTRSNLKYYKFNQQIKKHITKYPDLEYISLFETYFKQTTEVFLSKNPFPDNYKTYDNTHWDKNTTIDYVNKLLDKNAELKSKVSQ